MANLQCLPEDIIHTALIRARNLMRDEYAAMLESACRLKNGKPQRETIDSDSLGVALRYEHTLALVHKALKTNKATAPCGIVRIVKVPLAMRRHGGGGA